MTTRLDRLRGRRAPARGANPFADLYAAGYRQPLTTWGSTPIERIGTGFENLARGAALSSGVVFSVMLARLLLFKEVRFQFQRITNARPGDLFGTPALAPLETPWPNATTATLLGRMEQDASLAGNSFLYRSAGRDTITRLRPEWVSIIVGSPTGAPDDLEDQPLGYVYQVPGKPPLTLTTNDVAHYAPVPDPTAQFRGMSWLTPVIREIEADIGATLHKRKFFENAATPNMAVSLNQAVTKSQFEEFVTSMRAQHDGADNAYKTLYLAGGADVTVVGADMKQLDFKVTQGAGETRICAAGGVPPVIVGLSEGLSSATYSNYGMARRLFGDHWARPHWRDASAALGTIVRPPSDARLWFDDRDVSFLQEDRKDDADIAAAQATTIGTLIRAGYEPTSVVQAVTTGDFSRLEHTGLYSVLLRPPDPSEPPLT